MPTQCSVILGFMGQHQDQSSMYHSPRTPGEIAVVGGIGGINGAEMVYPKAIGRLQ
jgi:hypothetical protein